MQFGGGGKCMANRKIEGGESRLSAIRTAASTIFLKVHFNLFCLEQKLWAAIMEMQLR